MLVIRSTSADDEGLAVFRDLTNHQLRNAVDPERGIMICESEIVVRVDLGRGSADATVWTCDLSHDYVSINADYRS